MARAWPGAGPYAPQRFRPKPLATRRAQQFSGNVTVSASAAATLTRARALEGASSAIAAPAASVSRRRPLAGASSSSAAPASKGLLRSRRFSATSTAAAAPAATLRRARRLAGASSCVLAPAVAVALVRKENVLVDFGPELVKVVEGKMIDTGLKPQPFRSNESRALYHRLYLNGSRVDLTGWTIELWCNGSAIKSITGASSAATTGQIQNQTTNLGEYFFTVLAADVVSLLNGAAAAVVPARVRYVTPDTSPPRVFSTVVFAFQLTTP